jgi:hypothetical protein
VRRALAAAVILLAAAVAAVLLYVNGDFPASVPDGPPELSYQPYGEALRHVDSAGRVDYAGLAADRAGLDAFVAQLARVAPTNRPEAFPEREDQLAYWINAYNALVLQAVVDRYPGISSPKDLPASAFFWALTWPVGGKRLNLSSIEERARGFGDARVHFALVCASRGCPPLDSTPYMGETIDGQLNDAGRRFVRLPRAARVDGKTVHLSKIFEWYEADFRGALSNKEGGVLQIIWAFLPDACETRPGCDTRGDLDVACGTSLEQCKVVHDDWDWRLNDKPPPGAER